MKFLDFALLGALIALPMWIVAMFGSRAVIPAIAAVVMAVVVVHAVRSRRRGPPN